MSRAPRSRLAIALLIVLPGMAAPGAGSQARAGESEADEDLLEFLGGVGGEDAGFTDFLARTDIAQAAKPPAKPTPPPAPPPPPEVKKS
jgi:hypothetical protein